MAVWTISAQRAPEARVSPPSWPQLQTSLLDREALALFAQQIDPDLPEVDELEARLGGRLNTLALGTAITACSVDAFREIELRRKLPDLGRARRRRGGSLAVRDLRSGCVRGPTATSLGGSRPPVGAVRVAHRGLSARERR
jgi:hypothetical protein